MIDMDLEDGEIELDLEEGEISYPAGKQDESGFFGVSERTTNYFHEGVNRRNSITSPRNGPWSPPNEHPRPFWSQPVSKRPFFEENPSDRRLEHDWGYRDIEENVFDYNHGNSRSSRRQPFSNARWQPRREPRGFARQREPQPSGNVVTTNDSFNKVTRLKADMDRIDGSIIYTRRKAPNESRNRLPLGLVSNDLANTADEQCDPADDGYAMDDYELLLERHKLIQQQLKALNSGSKTQRSKSSDQHPSKNSPKVAKDARIEEKSNKDVKEETAAEPKPFEPFKLKPIRSKLPSLQERSVADAVQRGIFSQDENIEEAVVAEPPKVKRKRVSRRARKRARLLADKKSSIQNVAKQRLNTAKKMSFLAESKRKSVEEATSFLGSDDYTEMPMDIDSQDNIEIQKLLEGVDQVAVKTDLPEKPASGQVNGSAQIKAPLQESEVHSNRIVTAVTSPKTRTDARNDITVMQSKEENTEALIDKNDDSIEMLLREQLLRSLAAKRGSAVSKSKNGGVESNGEKSKPVSSGKASPIAVIKKTNVKNVIVKKVVVKNVKKPPAINTKVTLTPVTTGRLTPTITPMKVQSPLGLPKQKPVIIDLGADSDTEEDDTDDDDDSTGGINSIDSFLKEARQSTVMLPSPKCTPSTPSQQMESKAVNTPPSKPSQLQSVVACIDKASKQLSSAKLRLKSDQGKMKTLGVHLADKKTHLQQYTNKVKQLQHQLLAAEKLRRATLSLKTKLEEQISKSQLAFDHRKDLAGDLAEELLRAKSIVSESKRQAAERQKLLASTAGGTTSPMPNSIDVIQFNANSPAGNDTVELKPRVRRASSSKINDLLNRNMSKVKEALIGKSIALTASFKTNDHTAMGIKKPETKGSLSKVNKDQALPNALSGTATEAEKERLEKLEKELAMRLRRLSKPAPDKSPANYVPSKIETGERRGSTANDDKTNSSNIAKLLKLRDSLSKTELFAPIQGTQDMIGSDIVTREHPECVMPPNMVYDKHMVLFPRESAIPLSLSDPQSDESINKQTYRSALFHFKSYRLSPYFRTKAKMSLSSSSFSNTMDHFQPLCLYDLTGKCNDETCEYQHSASFAMTTRELLKDLLAYEQSLAGIHEKDTPQEKLKGINDFVDSFIGQYKDLMNDEQIVLLLVQKIRDRQRKLGRVGYQNICFDEKSLLQFKQLANDESSEQPGLQYELRMGTRKIRLKDIQRSDSYVDDEKAKGYDRYCLANVDDKQALRDAVDADTKNISNWMRLAKKLLPPEKVPGKTMDNAYAKSLEPSLNVLSQALEIKENRSSKDLWLMYLDLFAHGCGVDDLRHACYQAILHVPKYDVWWKCLELEKIYTEKQALCIEILSFLLSEPNDAEEKSHFCLETLLYLCCMEVSLENFDNTGLCFPCALGLENGRESPVEQQSVMPPSLIQYLTLSDRCLLWLLYVYYLEHRTLPGGLFAHGNAAPSRLVNKKPFYIVFNKERVSDSRDVMLCTVLENALKDAYRLVKDSNDVLQHVLPLHKALVDLLVVHGSLNEIKRHFEKLSSNLEGSARVWLLYLHALFGVDAVADITGAIPAACAKTNWDARVVLCIAQWHDCQGDEVSAHQLLSACVHQRFEDHKSTIDPRDLYRKLLGISGVNFTTSLPKPRKGSEITSRQEEHAALWLCYCLLLRLQESPATNSKYLTACEENFDLAVYSAPDKQHSVILWREYLSYLRRKLLLVYKRDDVHDIEDCTQRLLDASHRALMSDNPSRPVTFNPNLFWDDLAFQTEVIRGLLDVLDPKRHYEVYNHFGQFLRKNHLLASWAIRIELQQHHYKEARWLYEQAIKVLPFSFALWKNFLCFELSQAKDKDSAKTVLQKMLSSSASVGVSWSSLLSEAK